VSIDLVSVMVDPVGSNIAQARLLGLRKNLKKVRRVHSEVGLRLMGD